MLDQKSYDLLRDETSEGLIKYIEKLLNDVKVVKEAHRMVLSQKDDDILEKNQQIETLLNRLDKINRKLTKSQPSTKSKMSFTDKVQIPSPKQSEAQITSPEERSEMKIELLESEIKKLERQNREQQDRLRQEHIDFQQKIDTKLQEKDNKITSLQHYIKDLEENNQTQKVGQQLNNVSSSNSEKNKNFEVQKLTAENLELKNSIKLVRKQRFEFQNELNLQKEQVDLLNEQLRNEKDSREKLVQEEREIFVAKVSKLSNLEKEIEEQIVNAKKYYENKALEQKILREQNEMTYKTEKTALQDKTLELEKIIEEQKIAHEKQLQHLNNESSLKIAQLIAKFTFEKQRLKIENEKKQAELQSVSQQKVSDIKASYEFSICMAKKASEKALSEAQQSYDNKVQQLRQEKSDAHFQKESQTFEDMQKLNSSASKIHNKIQIKLDETLELLPKEDRVEIIESQNKFQNENRLNQSNTFVEMMSSLYITLKCFESAIIKMQQNIDVQKAITKNLADKLEAQESSTAILNKNFQQKSQKYQEERNQLIEKISKLTQDLEAANQKSIKNVSPNQANETELRRVRLELYKKEASRAFAFQPFD